MILNSSVNKTFVCVSVCVCTRFGEGLDEFLHGQHPGDSQMAVLEEYPVSSFQGLLDHLLRYGALALTQRYGLNPGGREVGQTLALVYRYRLKPGE